MKVNEIIPLQSTTLPGAETVRAPRQGEASTFKEIVNKYLEDTNQLQLKAGEVVRQMAAGEIDDIHDVMITVEKSRVSLELVIEIRDRLLEAYRELMRMQV